MTERTIVTLRSAPSESLEIPEEFGGKTLQRSCFGAIRLFPGVPKTVTRDELEQIKRGRPDVFARLTVQPYVESRRVDRRGASEADVHRLVEGEGLSHLPHARQVEVLRERGKMPANAPEKAPEAAEERSPGKRGGRVSEK